MNNLCQVVSVAVLSNRMSLKQLLIQANENTLIQMMNENSVNLRQTRRCVLLESAIFVN